MPADVAKSNPESAFDTLTRFGLEQLGMGPEFIADYTNWEILKDTYDFTKVDSDVSRNLVNTAGKHASKRAFEEVGKVVDRSMEILAGVLGATGQLYGGGRDPGRRGVGLGRTEVRGLDGVDGRRPSEKRSLGPD